ncbi:MAG: DUF86 domain-containing protein [Nitrospinae bacterium]|nr:DUF86 domain-containing protein [Nitrospinota bacterium]
MPLHDDGIRLRHMLDHAREALAIAKGIKRETLDSNRILSLALVRLLEIISEAANRVSDQCRRENPSLPWAQVVSLRNRLIHGYDSVDHDILWQILTGDLPVLVAELENILRKGKT